MKKAGPILLVVAVLMIAYLLVRPDAAAAEFKTDMLDIVLQGMGEGEERTYIESKVGAHHTVAARACKGAAQEEAFKIYMREQFKNLISQSEKDGRKELSRTVQGLAHATMGPREFAKPGAPPEKKNASPAPSADGAEPAAAETQPTAAPSTAESPTGSTSAEDKDSGSKPAEANTATEEEKPDNKAPEDEA